MKRKELIRHLETCGCLLVREGANHSVYVDSSRKKVSTVPRHVEINDILARKICKDLGITFP